ncbi:MAG: sugar kinase [Alphaproteobacteria bacterium]|nr:sugar kinase [Alphaproteobacteria bacterium]
MNEKPALLPRRVLCLGAAVLDTIFRVETIPTTPTKVLPLECVQLGAGMASSAAAAVARLGGQARIWARVGDDLAGRQYLDDLAAAGVDVSQVRRVNGRRTAVSTILVDREGQRLVVPFYDPALDPDPAWLPLGEVAGFHAAMVDVRWPAGAERLLLAARAAGLIGVLDGDIAPPGIVERLAPLASHVVFSEPALTALAGTAELAQALRRAAGMTTALVGVTAGERGFFWLEGATLRHAPAPRVTAVDTLAAGDVFHGAFALALAEGMDVAAAGRFACAAASLKCTRFGGRLGAPSRDEVTALIRAG